MLMLITINASQPCTFEQIHDAIMIFEQNNNLIFFIN